jgi:3-phenylpropionate/trans-cinnamate dioxygenase ferredoxin reductase component
MEASMSSTPEASMVIVGAGHCGGRAAQCLREAGWAGRIDLVAAESHPPYERPPLSKDLLTGQKTASACWLRAPEALSADGIRLHASPARSLDVAARTLQLENGDTLTYQSLLLATGGQARTLAVPGADLPQILTLRTLNDAAALAPRLQAGARLLVVGGGFIGLEVAASARSMGVAVTLVEGAPRLMGRAVPADVAERALQLHRARGVDVRLGTLPQAFEPLGDGVRVALSDGSALEVDTVVVGIGIEPALGMARDAGLAVGRGIVVNAQLQTSAPGVYAAGDVAEFPSALSGEPIRQETWLNAETQAKVVAANMLGGQEAYAQTPWFWSDQFDHQLQVTGEPAQGTASALRELGEGDQIAFYLDAANRLVGMSAWGRASRTAKEFKIARTLVERRVVASPEALADPSVKLKSLLAG